MISVWVRGLVSETTRPVSMAVSTCVRIATPIPICALPFLKGFSHSSRGNEIRTAVLKLFFFSSIFFFFCCFVFCSWADVKGLICKCSQNVSISPDQAQGQVDAHMRGCAWVKPGVNPPSPGVLVPSSHFPGFFQYSQDTDSTTSEVFHSFFS